MFFDNKKKAKKHKQNQQMPGKLLCVHAWNHQLLHTFIINNHHHFQITQTLRYFIVQFLNFYNSFSGSFAAQHFN
jgi:hypothetical protein